MRPGTPPFPGSPYFQTANDYTQAPALPGPGPYAGSALSPYGANGPVDPQQPYGVAPAQAYAPAQDYYAPAQDWAQGAVAQPSQDYAPAQDWGQGAATFAQPPPAFGWLQSPTWGQPTEEQPVQWPPPNFNWAPQPQENWQSAPEQGWRPSTPEPSADTALQLYAQPEPSYGAVAPYGDWNGAQYPSGGAGGEQVAFAQNAYSPVPQGSALYSGVPWAASGISAGGPGASAEAAHLLAAAQLVARSPAAPTLAGAGFAVGFGLRPAGDASFRVLHLYEGIDPRFFGHRWVEFRKRLALDATVAIGGGMGAVSGGVFVGAGRDHEFIFHTLVPPDRARELQKAQFDDAFHAALGLQFQSPVPLPDLRRPLEIPNCSNIYLRKTMTLSGGLVVGGTGFKATAYATLTGEFHIRLARLDDYALLGVKPVKVREFGAQLSVAFLNKINSSTRVAHATEWVVCADLKRPEALVTIEAGLAGRSPLPDTPASEEGTLIARYAGGMQAGVKLVQVEATELEEVDHTCKFLSSKAGASSNHATKSSLLETLFGVTVRDSTSHTRKVAVPLMGFESTGVALMAEYQYFGDPTTTPPTFVGLLLSMKLETGGGRFGDNREHLLEKVRAIFGPHISSFPPEAARDGYSFALERTLGAADFAGLAYLSREDIEQRAGTRGADTEVIAKLCEKMQRAAAAGLPAPTGVSADTDDYWGALAAQSAQPLAADATNTGAMLQTDVLQKHVRTRKTMTALCRLLGLDTLRVQVRGEAYEAPLLGLDALSLTYGGEENRIHHADSVKVVGTRMKKLAEIREQIDHGFEALVQDPVIAALLPDEIPARRASLDFALQTLEDLASMAHLAPLQRLCLVADEEVFSNLSVEEKAHSLQLLVQNRRPIPDLDQKRATVGKELHENYAKLGRLGLTRDRRAKREAKIQEALAALQSTQPSLEGTFGQLALLDPSPYAPRPWMPSPAPGANPKLLGLSAYETHIVIQDDAAIAQHLPEVHEALDSLVEEVSKYGQNGIEVSFVSDVLRGIRPRRVSSPGDVAAFLAELRAPTGSDAKIGNVVDALTRDYVAAFRAFGDQTRGSATLLITTGAMSDKDVFDKAMERTKHELGDGEDDRVRVGIVRVGMDQGGRNTADSLDAHDKYGNMIETSHSEDPQDSKKPLPVRKRCLALLEGMLDEGADGKNDVSGIRRGLRRAKAKIIR